MAALTLEIAQAKLTAYLNAEEKVLLNQAVDIEGSKVTFADLAQIQAGVRLWSGRVAQLERGGRLAVAEVIPK